MIKSIINAIATNNTWNSAIAFVIVAQVSSIHVASAQATNVRAKVDALLLSERPVPVTTTTQVPHVQQVCKDILVGFPPPSGYEPVTVCQQITTFTTVSHTVYESVKATNIRIVSRGNISWGHMTKTSFPNQIFPDQLYIQNCKDAPRPVTGSHTLSVKFVRTASIQFQKSVTDSQSFSTRFSAGGFFKVFQISAQLTIGSQKTVGEAHIESRQKSVIRSDTDSTTLLPGDATVLELDVWPVQYTIPFSTTVVVDADLSLNDNGHYHLSGLFPNPSTRTFTVDGSIVADDASAAHLVQYAVRYDPEKCHILSHLVVQTHITVPPNVKLFKLPLSRAEVKKLRYKIQQ